MGAFTSTSCPCNIINKIGDITIAARRYYTGKTLYSFGFGLPFWGSFPTYSALSLSSSSIAPCDMITVTVTVTAPAGLSVTGDDVAQVGHDVHCKLFPCDFSTRVYCNHIMQWDFHCLHLPYNLIN